jgi:hypothetical protein
MVLARAVRPGASLRERGDDRLELAMGLLDREARAGNMQATAKALGLTRRALNARCGELGLDHAGLRDGARGLFPASDRV